jgi:hypothetical protein
MGECEQNPHRSLVFDPTWFGAALEAGSFASRAKLKL